MSALRALARWLSAARPLTDVERRRIADERRFYLTSARSM